MAIRDFTISAQMISKQWCLVEMMGVEFCGQKGSVFKIPSMAIICATMDDHDNEPVSKRNQDFPYSTV